MRSSHHPCYAVTTRLTTSPPSSPSPFCQSSSWCERAVIQRRTRMMVIRAAQRASWSYVPHRVSHHSVHVRWSWTPLVPTQRRFHAHTPSPVPVQTSRTAAEGVSSRSLQLAPPTSLTHEHLTIVRCPLCGVRQGLETLLPHLINAHGHAHPVSAYQSLCRERLALYETVVGRPFLSPEERLQCGIDVELPPASATDIDNASNTLKPEASRASQEPCTSPLSPPMALSTASADRDLWRTQLPTVTAHGYICNWCVHRKTFRTRDALLLHVCHDHPLLDVDAVEPLVPALPSTSSTHAGVTTRADASVSTDRGWGQERHAGGSTAAGAVPLRRVLPGAFARPQDVDSGQAHSPALHARTPLWSRSQKTVSVPVKIDSAFSAAPLPPSHSTRAVTAFGVDGFPCELCQRRFSGEVGLLNHLLTSHMSSAATRPSALLSADEAETDADTPPAQRTAEDEARYMKRQVRALRESSGVGVSSALSGMRLRCDLCTHSHKVYTLPSALFAHIRFKHPREDAALHVQRLTRLAQHKQQQSQEHGGDDDDEVPRRLHDQPTTDSTDAPTGVAAKTGSFPCAFCARVFASADARQSHMAARHKVASTPSSAPSSTSTSTSTAASSSSPHTAPLLGPVTLKTLWWCPLCEKGFVSARSLISHAVGKHQRPLEALPCPACKRVLGDAYALEDHIKASHPTLNFADLGLSVTPSICDQCERRFLSAQDLEKHTLRHHRTSAATVGQAHMTPSSPRTPPIGADAKGSAAAHAAGTSPTSADALGSAATAVSNATTSGPRKVPRKIKKVAPT